MTAANSSKDPVVGAPIKTSRLGVYRLVQEVPSTKFRESWDQAARGAPSVKRLVKEIIQLGRATFCAYLLLQLWIYAVEPILSLHLTSRILVIIEEGFKGGQPDANGLFGAVVMKMLAAVATAFIQRQNNALENKMMHGIEFKLQRLVLRSKLRTDLTGVQAKAVATKHIYERSAWYAFRHFAFTGAQFFGALGQLAYVFRTVQSSGHGPLFVILCLVRPILGIFTDNSLWATPHLIEADDPHFLRMKNLLALGDKKYKQDVITGDIVQHIVKGTLAIWINGLFTLACRLSQYSQRQATTLSVLIRLSGDLPMLYYASNAILHPTHFSLATIATLQSIDSLLRWSFTGILNTVRGFTKQANRVKAIYDIEKIEHDATNGGMAAYPPEGQEDESEAGMAIELKNVSFSYPSNDTLSALKDVSLRIKSGQLVVLVGANGSGKSTIIKLLMRLYQPTSGSIMLGAPGHPSTRDIREYKSADLRRATAALTQDHHLFPLSLAENIGLGNPARKDDGEAVSEALRRGGANKVVERLKGGTETVLEGGKGLRWGSNVRKDEGTLLAAELAKMEKKSDVSGGERQRLVAARTFMRFTTNTVKLVCVDEPSANLDAEGELELFDNLRLANAGKTMVFVTHRFGHLTKHADMIVCMKEGKITEKGTHGELMAVDGEYAKMYGIQAKAFEASS
ncbi:ABC transporter ATP-binding protein [Mycena indigotica]|uniref:ABC transporter ATP-binding protein n=1 Tax=Mycena indigotica TaxID=2126181 RepID=A0A8H6TCJ3_9AGAR|nr:ABC transporter ATP-binding protein [Mycena indigotica]KAF7314970.1 ABC transporter ATP-binding protein [Mycena indigotica]